MKEGKYKFGSLISAIPASFMIAVTLTYILGEPHIAFGQIIPLNIAYIVGASVAVAVFILYIVMLVKLRIIVKNKNPIENAQI